jgi:hypothetical protein
VRLVVLLSAGWWCCCCCWLPGAGELDAVVVLCGRAVLMVLL